MEQEYSLNRHLPLAGAANVRDLGGYPLPGGRTTAWGVYLRADSTANLTPEDIDLLRKKGLALVIDLRSPGETANFPSLLRDIPGVRYENIVMFDDVNSSGMKGNLPDDMADMYIGLLQNCQEQYRHIACLLLECTGLALFHCTAGKDRTGVLAMLLLQLAGVDRQTIVADYAATEQYLPPRQHCQELAAQGIQIPLHVLQAQPHTMEKTLDYLLATWGGAAQYFAACGLSQEQVEALKKKLL